MLSLQVIQQDYHKFTFGPFYSTQAMQLRVTTLNFLVLPYLRYNLAQSSSSDCGISCSNYLANLYTNYNLYGNHGADVTGAGSINAAVAQVSCPQDVFDCYNCGGTGLTSSSWDPNPIDDLNS
jgi:hypothetical protein